MVVVIPPLTKLEKLARCAFLYGVVELITRNRPRHCLGQDGRHIPDRRAEPVRRQQPVPLSNSEN